MTENLEKTFEIADALMTIANQKRVLFEEYQQSLLYFYNGGTFKIDKDLICFLSLLQSRNNQFCVLIDANKLPIEIEDISVFLTKILDQYTRCSNQYFAEYQKIKNTKNLQSILDL